MVGDVVGNSDAQDAPDASLGLRGSGEPDAAGLRPLLDLRGIGKRFPGVVANRDVTFSVGNREIHALLGENGAGKSTLVKIIYGLMRPDEGVMHLAGQIYAPASPAEARARGVGMVFQHFSVFEALTVAENIALGVGGRADRKLRQRIADVSEAYGLKLDPRRQVGTLSAGERQRVEIERCLLQEPRLIIMDEPTSVLTPQEVEALFVILRRLVAEGCSILYISHKLGEIRELCDRATILRAGRVIASCNPARETTQSLARMMLGTSLAAPARPRGPLGPVRLKVSNLNLASEEQFGIDLDDIAFEVRGGEILGIAGIAGNGQTELMDALVGERLSAGDGTIEVDGIRIGRHAPSKRRELGLCSVREERLGHASVPDMALWENAALTGHARMRLARRGMVNASRARSYAQDVVREVDVRTPGVEAAARSLSGGNLQKFVVGREVLQAPAVLLVAQPTWGVDAGAALAIHEFLFRLAGEGAAILVVSQDLDELLAIADRIAVIANGHLSPALPVDQLTVESLGLKMGGRVPAGRVDA